MDWRIDSEEILGECRRRAGLTQQRLADLAGLSLRLVIACEHGEKPISVMSGRRLGRALLVPQGSREPLVSFPTRSEIASKELCRKMAHESVGDHIQALLREAEKTDSLHAVVLGLEEAIRPLAKKLKLKLRASTCSLRELIRGKWLLEQRTLISPVRSTLWEIDHNQTHDELGAQLPARTKAQVRAMREAVKEHDDRVKRESQDDRVLRKYFRASKFVSDVEGNILGYRAGLSLDHRIKMKKLTSFADYWGTVRHEFDQREPELEWDLKIDPVLTAERRGDGSLLVKIYPELLGLDEVVSKVWCQVGTIVEKEPVFEKRKAAKHPMEKGPFHFNFRLAKGADFCLLKFTGVTLRDRKPWRNFETDLFVCDSEARLVQLPAVIANWTLAEKKIRAGIERARQAEARAAKKPRPPKKSNGGCLGRPAL